MRRRFLIAFVLLLCSTGALSSEPLAFQEGSERVRVTATAANVRSGPGTDRRVILTVERGAVLSVLGREEKWYRVDLSGRSGARAESGYIHESTVELLPGGAPSGSWLGWLVNGALALGVLVAAFAVALGLWRRERLKRLRREAAHFFQEIRAQGRVPEATVDLLLQPGEVGVLQEEGKLCEAGARKEIESGSLILTNRRLVFEGDLENRTFGLNELVSVEPRARAIEVGVAGREGSQFFKVRNPLIWAPLVTALARRLASTGDPFRQDEEGDT